MLTKQTLKAAIRISCANINYLFGIHKFMHKGKTLILMYHRVLKDNDTDSNIIQPGMYVTESVFENQMKYLNENYLTISMDEYLEIIKKRAPNKDKKYCIVTFDDGWLDNYENAYPVLLKYKIPATIFLTTSFIGTNRWFWPDKVSYLLANIDIDECSHFKGMGKIKGIAGEAVNAIQGVLEQKELGTKESADSIIEKLKSFDVGAVEDVLEKLYEYANLSFPVNNYLLTWDMVEEMSREYISFGSHTCTHKILTGITLKEARVELEESMQILKARKIRFTPVFSYPNGNNNSEIAALVGECGYKAAFSTKYGFENAIPTDIFNIKRVGVHNGVSATNKLFMLHLSGLLKRN